jgi:hypothetical protein
MTTLPIDDVSRVSSTIAVASSGRVMLMCALQITDKRESHIGIAVMRRGAEKSSQYARVRQARAAFRDEWIQWHFLRVPANGGAVVSLAHLLR